MIDAPSMPGPGFAHGSEAEMARILDFYGVRWEYEPRTFPILWNLDGEVVESFSPDFYLPDLGLFLELTTLRQRLVRKKNRKLRRLRELYPDIRIKLFYARDFRAMMLKYGRLALADSLSGSLGQVVPERNAESDGTGLPGPDTGLGHDGGPGSLPADGPAEAPSVAARAGRNASRSRRRRAAAARSTAGGVADPGSFGPRPSPAAKFAVGAVVATPGGPDEEERAPE